MPILVPSSAKRITTQILVIAKLNGRKDFILRNFVGDIICPNKELPVQSYQVNNLSTRIRLKGCSVLRMSILTIFNIKDVSGVVSSVPIVNCKHISNCKNISNYFLTLNMQTFAWFILKRNIFKKTRLGRSRVMYCFKFEQNLLTNSIWTYTTTIIWVNQ